MSFFLSFEIFEFFRKVSELKFKFAIFPGPTVELSGIVKETADELMTAIYGTDRDAAALNEKFKIANQHSFAHRLACEF